MHLAVFITGRIDRHQAQGRGALPMRIGTRAVDERLGVGAAVEAGQVMGEAAILQSGLIGGDEHPIIVRLKQGPAFGAERRPLFGVWDLREIRFEMLGAAVRRADVQDAAMNAPVISNGLAPRLLAIG